MPSQAETTKVTNTVINPLMAIYGHKLNDFAIEAIVEDLAHYPQDVLVDAVKLVRRERKYFPTVAHILEACKKAQETGKKEEAGGGVFNFGQSGNGRHCGCGLHQGVGIWSPEYRAQKYAWFRSKYPSGYDQQRREYLETYEQAHGAVQPNM